MMKKLFFALLLVGGMSSLFTNVQAQCPLTQAVDFTVTDLEGTEYQLFDILDNQGKYVLIDFFFTTCGPCQQAAPKVNEAYERFGCNAYDVVFFAMDKGNNNAECEAFDEQFGVHYPTISGVEGGGTDVCIAYGINAFPTVILIAPDHTIVEQDIFPIPSAQTIVNKLKSYGIQEHDCNDAIEEASSINLQLWPNPSHGVFNIQSNDADAFALKVYDIAGRVVFQTTLQVEQTQLDLSHLPKGMYVMHFANGQHQYQQSVVIH